MRLCVALLCIAFLLSSSPEAASAGIADTPLPRFAGGKPSFIVFARTGVIKRGRLQTDFACTSGEAGPVDIAAEIFGSDGALMNDVGAGVGILSNVAQGRTVTIGTSGTAAFLETLTLPVTQVAQGSVRIVASSTKVECIGTILDARSTPPASIGELAPGIVAAPGPVIDGLALPRFADGTPATHAMVFPGAVKRGPMQTGVFCTSLATVPVRIGVEMIGADGQVMNDVHAGNGGALGVVPGATVTFSTTGTLGFLETLIIETAGIAQGIARVVSDSAEVLCNAVILDSDQTPPLSMSTLLGTNGLGVGLPSPTASPQPTPTATAAPVCAGDCDGSGQVTVDELVTGISIALGALPVTSCSAFDGDAGGTVTVDEIVRSVGAALGSCVGAAAALHG